MARRMAAGNGDRFGFVSYWGTVETEDGDGLDSDAFPVDGVNLEDWEYDTDIDDHDDYDATRINVVVSAPYTYGGYEVANVLNGIPNIIAESEFEPLDMPDDMGPRLFVEFDDGHNTIDAESDVVDLIMARRGIGDDEIRSINGIPWPFDGYRR